MSATSRSPSERPSARRAAHRTFNTATPLSHVVAHGRAGRSPHDDRERPVKQP